MYLYEALQSSNNKRRNVSEVLAAARARAENTRYPTAPDLRATPILLPEEVSVLEQVQVGGESVAQALSRAMRAHTPGLGYTHVEITVPKVGRFWARYVKKSDFVGWDRCIFYDPTPES